MRLTRKPVVLALALALAGCGGSKAPEPVKGGVGRPASGSVAWKFVGRIAQDGDTFTGRGYVTHIDGLPDGDLFTSADQSERTARFTVAIDGKATGRSKLQAVTVVDSSGTATVRFNQSGGASFDDPASFTRGSTVAVASVIAQDVLSITSTDRNQGIAAATAQLTQTEAGQFDLAGASHQFGGKGDVTRMALNGQGVRTDPKGPRSLIEVAGDVIAASSG